MYYIWKKVISYQFSNSFSIPFCGENEHSFYSCIASKKKKILWFFFFFLQLKTLSEQLSKLEQDRWQFYTSLGNAQRKLVDVWAESQKLRQSAEDVLSNLEKSRTEEAELLIELDKERYCFIYAPNLKLCIVNRGKCHLWKIAPLSLICHLWALAADMDCFSL